MSNRVFNSHILDQYPTGKWGLAGIAVGRSCVPPPPLCFCYSVYWKGQVVENWSLVLFSGRCEWISQTPRREPTTDQSMVNRQQVLFGFFRVTEMIFPNSCVTKTLSQHRWRLMKTVKPENTAYWCSSTGWRASFPGGSVGLCPFRVSRMASASCGQLRLYELEREGTNCQFQVHPETSEGLLWAFLKDGIFHLPSNIPLSTLTPSKMKCFNYRRNHYP